MGKTRKGEIVTIITIGALIVLGITSLITSRFLGQNKQITNTLAAGLRCPGPNCDQCGKNGFCGTGCPGYPSCGGANTLNCPCANAQSCYQNRWCGNDCQFHDDLNVTNGCQAATPPPVTSPPPGGGGNATCGSTADPWYCAGECANQSVRDTFNGVYPPDGSSQWKKEKAKNCGFNDAALCPTHDCSSSGSGQSYCKASDGKTYQQGTNYCDGNVLTFCKNNNGTGQPQTIKDCGSAGCDPINQVCKGGSSPPPGGGALSKCDNTGNSCADARAGPASITYNSKTVNLVTNYYPSSDTDCSSTPESLQAICQATAPGANTCSANGTTYQAGNTYCDSANSALYTCDATQGPLRVRTPPCPNGCNSAFTDCNSTTTSPPPGQSTNTCIDPQNPNPVPCPASYNDGTKWVQRSCPKPDQGGYCQYYCLDTTRTHEVPCWPGQSQTAPVTAAYLQLIIFNSYPDKAIKIIAIHYDMTQVLGFGYEHQDIFPNSNIGAQLMKGFLIYRDVLKVDDRIPVQIWVDYNDGGSSNKATPKFPAPWGQNTVVQIP